MKFLEIPAILRDICDYILHLLSRNRVKSDLN